ncbi:MAG: gas vesicle protein K [Thermodesulfobacteriota bacterium]
MSLDREPAICTQNMGDFLRVMAAPGPEGRGAAAVPGLPGPRLDLEPADLKNGLGKLVLTLVKLLHELMERQAIRRLEAGSLSEEQTEKIGATLLRQAEEIDRLRREFNLEEEDLNLDLGPLGRLF